MPDEARSLETYLTSGQESRPELFGQESLPGASLEADEEVSLENAVLAAPADLFFPGSQWSPKEFHSAGTPAPLGGRTFGVSVASFPGSQWVMNEDLFSLLGREFTNDMLYSAMGGGGEGVELGLEPANLAPGSATMLGTETEIRSFVGSVDGPTVPHGVGIHAARVETEEVVVLAVGAHNWPSGVAGQPTYSSDVAERARAYFAAVLERLDYEVDVTATTPTPTAPGSDRRSDTVPIPPMTLSKAESVDVQEQSRFAIEFEALTECPMDVFVIPAEPFRTFVDSGDERRPDEIRDGHESLAREHSPEELRFFGEATGRGTAELSAGTHFVVFTRTCELGTRTAVEFTAEIEAGSF
jgi:hypothetical protein